MVVVCCVPKFYILQHVAIERCVHSCDKGTLLLCDAVWFEGIKGAEGDSGSPGLSGRKGERGENGVPGREGKVFFRLIYVVIGIESILINYHE